MTRSTPSDSITGTREFNLKSLIVAILVAAPGLVSFAILYLQRLPFPYLDDYKAILAFAADYQEAPTVTGKALLVAVAKHNFYRLIFQHGIVAAEVELTHHVNFAFLTALGDLFLVGIAVLLWRVFFRVGGPNKVSEFLPVSFLFFSLVYWESVNWAMASLQNLPVIFFALLALCALVPRTSADLSNVRFFVSCLAACLSCCSSANGFLLAPIGVVMLFKRRSYKQIALWLLSFALPLWAYLYQPGASTTHLVPSAKQPMYFIAFFGSVLPQTYAAFFLGVVVLAFFGWIMFIRKIDFHPVLFPFAVWIVLTGALVEAVRVSLASRYSIYSVLMLICCYHFLLTASNADLNIPRPLPGVTRRREHVVRWALACSLLLYLFADTSAYRSLRKRRDMTVAGMIFYRTNPLTNSPQINRQFETLVPEETPFELQMLNRAEREHLYEVPPMEELQRYLGGS